MCDDKMTNASIFKLLHFRKKKEQTGHNVLTRFRALKLKEMSFKNLDKTEDIYFLNCK